VRDIAGLAGQRVHQVLAHPAEVIQVGEERDVGDAPARTSLMTARARRLVTIAALGMSWEFRASTTTVR
jgi:hypothetical protein